MVTGAMAKREINELARKPISVCGHFAPHNIGGCNPDFAKFQRQVVHSGALRASTVGNRRRDYRTMDFDRAPSIHALSGLHFLMIPVLSRTHE